MTKNLANKNPFLPLQRQNAPKINRLFEVEPYSRMNGESLQELRDNLRLKKAMRRAIEQDTAPAGLIEAIRQGIRA